MENFPKNISNFTIETKTTEQFTHIEKILFYTIYSLVFLLALQGNIIFLIMLNNGKRMKIVHNYFIVNITVSNLIYTLCVPFQLVVELNDGEWILFEVLCPIIPFVSTFSINLNTFTTAVSAVERLIVIVYPFRLKLSKKDCIKIIISIWLFAILFSAPWLKLVSIENENTNLKLKDLMDLEYEGNQVKTCLPRTDYDIRIIQSYFLFLCIVEYILPIIILSFTYSIIFYYLKVVNAKSILDDANKLNSQVRKKNNAKVFLQIIFILLNN